MANTLFNLISSNDSRRIRKILIDNPVLVNEGVPLGDTLFSKRGHPLHRLCDAVFAKKITDDQAVDIAKILIEFGADIDGYKSSGDNNTPLIAAASLHAEKLGIYYVEQGADVFYVPKSDGATALHWAAYCGLDMLLENLIGAGANINQPDTRYNSMPAGWALHALISGDAGKNYHQLHCVKILLRAGADQSLLNAESMEFLQSQAKNDPELRELIT